MHPFISLGPLKVPVYGLCIVIGLLSGGLAASSLCKKRGKDFLDFIIPSVLIISFGFITAKVLYLLITFSVKDFFYICFKMLFGRDNSMLSSGFVFMGGLPGAILGYLLGIRIAKCKTGDFLDVYGVIVPFVHAWGRIGCFYAGCCYGILLPHTLIHFPVQLLESSILFLISLAMKIRYDRGKKGIMGTYLFVYSFCRFFLEYLRGDTARGFFWKLSTSQWLCIFVVAGTLIHWGIKWGIKQRGTDLGKNEQEGTDLIKIEKPKKQGQTLF